MSEKKTSELAVLASEVVQIKATFKDNDYLLKVMRNLFFGFALSDGDKKIIIDTFGSNQALREVVRKKMYPQFKDTIDLDIGFAADFWLDIEKEILGAYPDAINQRVMSKQQVGDMLATAVALLENPDGKKVDMSYNPKLILNDPFQINLLARSLFIRSVGQGLGLLKLIANAKEETSQQTKDRLEKDSSK